jgi:hypothetical protein
VAGRSSVAAECLSWPHRDQYAAAGSTPNAKVTERPAGNAGDCAEFMIALAYSAIAESEYAALQAVPAWQDAYAVC